MSIFLPLRCIDKILHVVDTNVLSCRILKFWMAPFSSLTAKHGKIIDAFRIMRSSALLTAAGFGCCNC